MSLSEILAIVSAAAVLIGGAWTLLKLAASQYQRALTAQLGAMENALGTRLDTMERAREESHRLHESRFARVEEGHAKTARELLEFKLDVSETRTHRDDFVRNMTLIEAKLDGMATKMENWFLRMRKHDGS
jgi:hypothetical protein